MNVNKPVEYVCIESSMSESRSKSFNYVRVAFVKNCGNCILTLQAGSAEHSKFPFSSLPSTLLAISCSVGLKSWLIVLFDALDVVLVLICVLLCVLVV